MLSVQSVYGSLFVEFLNATNKYITKNQSFQSADSIYFLGSNKN